MKGDSDVPLKTNSPTWPTSLDTPNSPVIDVIPEEYPAVARPLEKMKIGKGGNRRSKRPIHEETD